MTFQRRRIGVGVAVLGLASLAVAAGAYAAPATHVIPANVNDSGIDPARGQNLIFLASDPARRVGKLLVIMAGGGATNLPPDWSELGSEGARLGYHTIVLAYKNELPIAAPPPGGCGNNVDPPSSPPNCSLNARLEILDGQGESSVVAVDRANSIENRLTKVLQYLAASYPAEGWAPFVDASGAEPAPRWSQIAMSGQSLGAGQAVLAGMLHPLYRVVAFGGWADAKHGWVAPGLTPVNRYFSLIHARDNLLDRTCHAYIVLGLAPACPLPGFTIAPVDAGNPLLVENREPPFGTSQLVFNLEPFKLDGVADPYHTSTTRDGWIARESDGTPSRRLLNAWRSVLGDSDGDGDTRLDAFAAGAVGGSVPATLALALGTPAAFGPFTPGVDRDYDAATTATVISSAGDATLAVSDSSTSATGRLVNGPLSLSEPLQVRASGDGAVGAALATLSSTAGSPLSLLSYAGPVSNGAVAIAFRQHISQIQALRTGAYSKFLTFTLSTTTP